MLERDRSPTTFDMRIVVGLASLLAAVAAACAAERSSTSIEALASTPSSGLPCSQRSSASARSRSYDSS
ncbi:MAG: hypothetical protein FJW96_11140 [Actinobacteria bacterium]|nr:hypothetical protein [Actinomycetota bacterium]